MAKAAFKKGQEVTYIQNWDSNGTFTYTHAVVYSCGQKQMVLTDAGNGREMGRRFKPELGHLEAGYGDRNGIAFHVLPGGTFPRMTDEEAEAACLLAGAAQNAHYAAHWEGLKATVWAHAPEVMDEEIAELHEPRALNRTGTTN